MMAAACGSGGDDDDDGKADDGGTAGVSSSSGGRAETSSGGRASQGGRSNTGGTHSAGATSEGGAESVGGEAGQGGAATTFELPYQLTQIGQVDAATAHVSLYFTVTDANGEPVPNLQNDAFVAKEDDSAIDPDESAFQVTTASGKLAIPTVLLLDVSRSVDDEELELVKSAAEKVIYTLEPAQRLAIMTFSETTQLLIDFSSDQEALLATLGQITRGGISTNLYGALQAGYAKWTDGFYRYDDTVVDPQLVAGLMIVVTDGNDTASVSTLSSALAARGTKRTIFIRVGDELDEATAREIGNAGMFDVTSFDELGKGVEAAADRISRLNSAIYAAEYCSPRRSGTHELLFTLHDNESYLANEGGSDPLDVCSGYTSGSSECEAGENMCGGDGCCPYGTPFACVAEGKCYSTQEAAYAACGSSCRSCGAVPSSDLPSAGTSGTAIEVSFSAQGFSSTQCDALFAPPDDGSGGAGGAGGVGAGGAGAGGAGGTGGTGGASSQCALLQARIQEQCGTTGPIAVATSTDLLLVEGCAAPNPACTSEFNTLMNCLALDSEAYFLCGSSTAIASYPCLDAADAVLSACNP